VTPGGEELSVDITLGKEQNSGTLPHHGPVKGGQAQALQLELFPQLNLLIGKVCRLLGLIQLKDHLVSHRKLELNAPDLFLAPA
jgi:hypothetical protein